MTRVHVITPVSSLQPLVDPFFRLLFCISLCLRSLFSPICLLFLRIAPLHPLACGLLTIFVPSSRTFYCSHPPAWITSLWSWVNFLLFSTLVTSILSSLYFFLCPPSSIACLTFCPLYHRTFPPLCSHPACLPHLLGPLWVLHPSPSLHHPVLTLPSF